MSVKMASEEDENELEATKHLETGTYNIGGRNWNQQLRSIYQKVPEHFVLRRKFWSLVKYSNKSRSIWCILVLEVGATFHLCFTEQSLCFLFSWMLMLSASGWAGWFLCIIHVYCLPSRVIIYICLNIDTRQSWTQKQIQIYSLPLIMSDF